jgi:hypothetical protein
VGMYDKDVSLCSLHLYPKHRSRVGTVHAAIWSCDVSNSQVCVLCCSLLKQFIKTENIIPNSGYEMQPLIKCFIKPVMLFVYVPIYNDRLHILFQEVVFRYSSSSIFLDWTYCHKKNNKAG